MNVKKAVKRLNRAEVLLARVLDQYGKKHPHAQGLLRTAKESLNRAKVAIGGPAPSEPKRAAAAVEENKSPRPARPAAKKQLAPATKKQAAPAAKKLSPKSKRAAAKKAPTVNRAAAKKAVRRAAPAQPAAKKQTASSKRPTSVPKRPGQVAKPAMASAMTASRPAPLPAKSSADTPTPQSAAAPESAARVIDGPADLRRY